MEQRDLIDISDELLKEARADLELAKMVLYSLESTSSSMSDKIKKRIIYSLQQASEKALKAYFMSTFVGAMVSFSSLIDERNDRKRGYGRCISLIKRAKNYTKPRAFGHNFSGFFNYMNEVFREFNNGKMGEYLALLFERVAENIEHLMSRNSNATIEEKEFITESLKLIASIFRESSVDENSTTNRERPPTIIQSSSDKSLKSPKYPCIRMTSEKYLALSTKLENGLEDLKGEIALSTKELEEITGITFPESLSNLNLDQMLQIVMDLIKPIFVIPLHLCLTKYESSSRYPSGLNIPEEDLDPSSITLAIDVLGDLLETMSRQRKE